MKISIKNTLNVIRRFKNGTRDATYYNLRNAVKADAEGYVGDNLTRAMWMAERAGNPYTEAEAKMYNSIYWSAMDDAMAAIINKAHRIIPAVIKDGHQFRIAEHGL